MSAKRGWSAIEKARERDAMPLPKEEDREVQMAVRRMLDTEDGKTFLRWLMGVTLERETWHPLGLRADRETRVDYGHFREGQNSIARIILAMRDGKEIER